MWGINARCDGSINHSTACLQNLLRVHRFSIDFPKFASFPIVVLVHRFSVSFSINATNHMNDCHRCHRFS